jgi:F0F1-type ATP synthase membrane subunit b/b'
MLGLFLVLLLILWQFLWKPYLRVRDERVARVEGAREKAAKLEADAAARLVRIETALTEARRNGNAEIAKLRLEAQAREQQIITEAQDSARKMMLEARAKLATPPHGREGESAKQTNLLGRQIAEKRSAGGWRREAQADDLRHGRASPWAQAWSLVSLRMMSRLPRVPSTTPARPDKAAARAAPCPQRGAAPCGHGTCQKSPRSVAEPEVPKPLSVDRAPHRRRETPVDTLPASARQRASAPDRRHGGGVWK